MWLLLATMLADRKADFLLDRLPVLQEPGLVQYEQHEREDGTRISIITGDTPIWHGQNLAICTQQMND